MAFSRRQWLRSSLVALGSAAVRAGPAAGRLRPTLVILLVAEQFRPDYLERSNAFYTVGGLRKLVEEGCYFPDCRLACSSFTATALATLATGAYPAAHGIVADLWFDGAGVAAAKPEACQATTLPDELSTGDGRNRVLCVAGSEAGAAWWSGAKASISLFAADDGAWSAQGSSPAWLSGVREKLSPEKWHDARWMALGARPEAPPLRTLRFDAGNPGDFEALYRSSPFAQAAEMEMAREVILREKLGRGPDLDFLAIHLAAIASLAREVGADSPLMQQMIWHLDREVETLLDAVTRTGAANYAVVFTAAHGSGGEPSERRAVNGEALAAHVNQALSDRFDIAPARTRFVRKYFYPFLYLDEEKIRRHDLNAREVRMAAAKSALRFAGVNGYYTRDGDCSHAGEWLRLFQNSFHAARSGDLILAYRPGWQEETGASRGVSFGSLYNYDTRLPLALYGPAFEQRTMEAAVEAVDLAPTLARLLGTATPSSATGRVLGEAFAVNWRR